MRRGVFSTSPSLRPDRRRQKAGVFLKIIIVGSGKVGYTLAEQLVREKHDITVLDRKEEALKKVSDTLDLMTVRGSGVSVNCLREAGAETADVLVAATDSDEINMVCCLMSKNVGTKYTIARIRDPEYTDGLGSLQRDLGIDLIINPESATAAEISRLLRFPAAANIDSFCRGKVELMGFRLQEGDFLVGKPLRDLSDRVKKLSLLFCAAQRDDGVIIPNGAFVPRAGDKLYLIGRPGSLDQFFRTLGRYTPKVNSVFIAGGGKISLYLAQLLERTRVQVKILERDADRCRFISEQLPRSMVIQGESSDQQLLESERLSASDAFVALTDRDEDNLIVSLYALQQGVAKVIAKSNEQNYVGIAQSIGLDSVISPKLITAQYILQVVRGMQNSQGSVMNALYRIANGGAEAMEFTVSPATRGLNTPLKNLHLRPGVLIAVIARGDEIIIPEGSSRLMAGDSVILISRNSGILDLNDIFTSIPTTGQEG